MSWLFLALLAPFIYAINVFLDKYIISTKISDYRSLPIFGVFLALPIFIILGFNGGFWSVSLKDALLVVITGVFTILAFALYLEALIKEDTSIVIILMQLTPALVLILSYLILGEMINYKQLLGFIFLFTSSILISLKKEKSSLKLSKGLIYILLADILWSIPYILIKFASGSMSFANLVTYESGGVVIGGALLLIFVYPIKQAFIKTIKKIKKPVLAMILFNESLFLGGKIITYLAITLGPAVLVSVVGSTQVFFGILFGIILTLTFPKVFKENLSKVGLTKKASLGLLVLMGVILIS